MVLDLRQRAETPSVSEATEVTETAKAKKNGSRRANEVTLPGVLRCHFMSFIHLKDFEMTKSHL